MKKPLACFFLALSLVLLCHPPSRAMRSVQTGVEGLWQGTLEIGPVKLRLLFKLGKTTDGTLSGTLDSIDQGAMGIKLDAVMVKEKTITIELKSIGGAYEGTFNDDETQILGHWRQGGQSLPLVLKRVEKAPELNRPQEPKKPYPYDEEEVIYDGGEAGVKLAGTLTLPRAQAPFSAVVLITGSGPQDRNEALMGHKPFLVLADHLTRKGIAVLRSDDRGIGKSTGSFAKATTEDFANDALAGIQYLKSRKEINAKQIGLVGHSEGGVVAPMVATKSQDVAFVVLMAGTAITGEEILYLQGGLIAKANGAGDDAIARQRALQQAMFTVIKGEKDDAVAEKKLRETTTKVMAELSEEQRKAAGLTEAGMEAQAKTLLSPWFRFFLTYDPAPTLRKLKCPVLAINGELDLQVPAKENLPGIARALEEGGNDDYTVVKLPRLNHLFQTTATGSVSEYGKIEETMSPVALDTISDWILRRTNMKR